MTIEEYIELFKEDEERKYVNLIVPATENLPALDMRGKSLDDLSYEEAFRVKRYAGRVLEEVR